VEFALSVPARRKVRLLRRQRKVLMREAAAAVLPPEIAWRPKHGFTPPLDRWLDGNLGSLARDVLLDAAARLGTRVDMRQVRRLLVDRRPVHGRGHKIWALLVYELWSRQYAVA
jgi:asparagine synthase (glutamine-hydrolysing)